ncbi:MAG TPA: VOC family protein, partial [Gammaproteobacteria bacterium]|nr:VOC family protein [Gammaproteobacteria bacterium]
MATTHGTFVWYELLTGDSHAAEKFYSDVVGWQISDAGMPNMDYRICTAGQEAIAGIMQLTDEMQSAGTRP